ncbi:MAG: hypothetical protein WA769_11365, partial [Pseudolabrys sp.]
MTNKNTRNFGPSDDALILQQPVSGIGLKTLAKMIRATPEMLIRRAGELGVSLDISDWPLLMRPSLAIYSDNRSVATSFP